MQQRGQWKTPEEWREVTGGGDGGGAGSPWDSGNSTGSRAVCPPPPTSVRSYTLQVVQGNADTFWKFQRYHLIVEYHERPSLAPPFILLSHLNLVLKRFFRKEAQQKRRTWVRLGLDSAARTEGGCLAFPERDLPEPLDQKMVTWEAVQKENFLSELEKPRKDSGEELLRETAHRCGDPARPRPPGWAWQAAWGAEPTGRLTGTRAPPGALVASPAGCRFPELQWWEPTGLCCPWRGPGKQETPRGWPAALEHLSHLDRLHVGPTSPRAPGPTDMPACPHLQWSPPQQDVARGFAKRNHSLPCPAPSLDVLGPGCSGVSWALPDRQGPQDPDQNQPARTRRADTC
ncbi:hypothetical protein J1605_002361 [Eschrichtius robustus]|uniref:Uncharacterized protein n=1 Tax=Eschrichtius robustus TaxID=9764 RepID=A0AB34HW45_ESCRO|nr:hypothetical protein J1605_002361 [Eschrichtius robustus]